jgi:hypothetical protein
MHRDIPRECFPQHARGPSSRRNFRSESSQITRHQCHFGSYRGSQGRHSVTYIEVAIRLSKLAPARCGSLAFGIRRDRSIMAFGGIDFCGCATNRNDAEMKSQGSVCSYLMKSVLGTA